MRPDLSRVFDYPFKYETLYYKIINLCTFTTIIAACFALLEAIRGVRPKLLVNQPSINVSQPFVAHRGLSNYSTIHGGVQQPMGVLGHVALTSIRQRVSNGRSIRSITTI